MQWPDGQAELRDWGTGLDLADYRGKLAVVTGSRTAWSAEVVAAAIQDTNRGLVIGERTFGKGTVQSLRPIGENSGASGLLKLTRHRFLRISGGDFQHDGVIPDVVLPGVSWRSFSERDLRHALSAMEVDAMEVERFSEVEAPIEELRRRSGERLAEWLAEVGGVPERSRSLNAVERIRAYREARAALGGRSDEAERRELQEEEAIRVVLDWLDLAGQV